MGTRKPFKPIKGSRVGPFWVIFEFYVIIVIKYCLCAKKYTLCKILSRLDLVHPLPQAREACLSCVLNSKNIQFYVTLVFKFCLAHKNTLCEI